ncbi:MAG TPA: hypothetical protein VH744_11225 [Terriglobales bacterium]
MKKFYRKLLGWMLLVCLCWAQVAGEDAGATSAGESPAATQTAQPEPRKVSPQEAEELFRSIDEIVKFSSQETALPLKHPIKRRMVSRDEVVAYLSKHMAEDEDARRLQRSELVLKKFGLLPRDFDLQKFLVTLLREQVAGFYDPKTKTVNLLDWVDPEQQKPVLAHELTHALQDQSFGLEKWMKAGAADLAQSKKAPTTDDIESDEVTSARQALVEGQAMVVLIDYMLVPMGQSMSSSPQIAEALKEGMLVGTADSIQFRNAPNFIKQALTFPYRYGLDFVAAVLAKQGKEKAFAGMFTNPPRSTRQIMEPATYLSGEKIEPLRLPDFARIFRNYERFDVGAIGEFDVALLVDEYAGSEASRQLYPQWRGGYYYAARPKDDTSAPLGLLYVSRWSNVERAAEFAAIYAKSLTKRYRRAREAVSDDSKPLNLDALSTMTGSHIWLTEEGPVVIVVEGETVLVTESLDPQATGEVEKELFAAAVAGR